MGELKAAQRSAHRSQKFFYYLWCTKIIIISCFLTSWMKNGSVKDGSTVLISTVCLADNSFRFGSTFRLYVLRISTKKDCGSICTSIFFDVIH